MADDLGGFDSNLLTATSRALYGEAWQPALAVDLGITDRELGQRLAGD